jgi:hypothetical protein
MNGELVIAETLQELRVIARRFDPSIELAHVQSIQAWCKQNGVAESNPFRCGKTVQNTSTGVHTILLADVVTEAMRNSVISGMQQSPQLSYDDLALLDDPSTFLKHLLLHEVAHALDHQRTEEECDKWAFGQLKAL